VRRRAPAQMVVGRRLLARPLVRLSGGKPRATGAVLAAMQGLTTGETDANAKLLSCSSCCCFKHWNAFRLQHPWS
jgi:hypothetical protein